MTTDTVDRLEAIILEATTGLLLTYGFTAKPSEDDAQIYDIAASIGFSGPQLNGALFLAANRGAGRTLVARTLGATNVRDWLGELTNQLLGSIQRGLLGHQVAITGGLPTVVSGVALDVSAVRTRKSRRPDYERICAQQLFIVAGGYLLARIEVEVEIGFELCWNEDHAGNVPSDGDTLLF